MSNNSECIHCGKSILEGVSFCPHCGEKQISQNIFDEFDRDPYEVLQVSRSADPEIIEVAYKRLAKIYHPDNDSSPTAKERMQELNWAYEILSDPDKRKTFEKKSQKKSFEDFGKGDSKVTAQDEVKAQHPSEERSNQQQQNRNQKSESTSSPSIQINKPRTEYQRSLFREPQFYVPAIITVCVILFVLQSSFSDNVSGSETGSQIISNNNSGSKNENIPQKTLEPVNINKPNSHSPSISSLIEAYRAYKDLVPFLYELSDEPIIDGSYITYNVENLENKSVLWGWLWCSESYEILEENLGKIDLTFRINNKSVGLYRFRSSVFSSDFELEEDGPVSAKCKEYYIELVDWPSGEHVLRVDVKFTDTVDDGWEVFPKGTIWTEIYNVTVLKNSNDSNFSPQKSPTKSDFAFETSTPELYRQGCIYWSDLNPGDVSKKRCVYGRVEKINTTSEFIQIIRFSSEAGTFMIRGKNRLFEVNPGECIVVEGIVQKEVTYLYMDAAASKLYSYEGCN